MKLRTLVVAVAFIVGLVGLAGCGPKQPQGVPMAPMNVEGVSVDIPKLQAAIDAGTNAELQASVRTVTQSFRYRMYEKALMEMDKVVNDPNLTDDQKKLATQVLEQVKQVVAKAPAPPQ